MRLTFCILYFYSSFSHENTFKSKSKLNANETVSLNSNGMAPVPAFSLGKPAITASASFVKNRFSYEPTLAYGLDLRCWFIDN